MCMCFKESLYADVEEESVGVRLFSFYLLTDSACERFPIGCMNSPISYLYKHN